MDPSEMSNDNPPSGVPDMSHFGGMVPPGQLLPPPGHHMPPPGHQMMPPPGMGPPDMSGPPGDFIKMGVHPTDLPPPPHPQMLLPPPGMPPPDMSDQLMPPGTTQPNMEMNPDHPFSDPSMSQSLPSLLTMHVERPPNMPPPGERDQKLPHALEKALAFKSQRASEIGEEERVESSSKPTPEVKAETPVSEPANDDSDEEEEEERDDKEAEKKAVEKKVGRKKKKKSKRRKSKPAPKTSESSEKENTENTPEVEIEYIQEKLNIFELEPMYRGFAKVFETFMISELPSLPDVVKEIKAEDILGIKRTELTKVPKLPEEDEDMEEDQEGKDEDKPKLSKRKLKKLTRLSIAELKQLVNRPDVVEMHDVTARDPKLLVQLKAHRNTVPVPRHWCFKRKYLQGKRGIEKPPFDLPDFIRKTGIMEMRSSLQDKEEQRTLKAKMRERARPKMGKIDIDYQKLHDAFFKWQTKPRLTIHGDLYYEGKEFETRLREKKPGDLSPDLRTALGMPVGPAGNKVPPPWLIAMQRYGPPPSYPNLKIPGLNTPIPEGCSFGYHAGGWGKPPVDETGKPLYGDVFATAMHHNEIVVDDDEIEKSVWGELESDSEEESEEEEEEEGGGEEDESGLVTPAEGLVTPSGITSVPTGMETPDIIELRKKKIESEMDGGDTPALYQVLAEKRVDRIGAGMMASTHTYELPTASAVPRRDAVELALDPSELDMDSEAMAARYEQQMREQQSHLQKEDLSDMLVEHVSRQKNKRKKQQSQDSKQAKKYKEFKF